jgi:hypothetical protein
LILGRIPGPASGSNRLEGGISYRTLVLNTMTPFEDFTNQRTRVLWRRAIESLRLKGTG